MSGGSSVHFPADPPSPQWWPLEETLVGRGSSELIYTFGSQFGDGGDHSQASTLPPPPPSADVDFLRGLLVEGDLVPGGAIDAPLQRLMISPAASVAYNEGHMPTPATLVADLKATANFRSAIADMNNDGSEGPLPYLGYQNFDCADEVHEDAEKQYLFPTAQDVADLAPDDEDSSDVTIRGRQQLAALREYVVKQRVFYVLIHTDRREHAGDDISYPDMSSMVLLTALGVSPTTGNLVGVCALQVCHNLCD